MNGKNMTRPVVSTCETYHLNELGLPLYDRRFSRVLPFHPPGLAPVRLEGAAWHIQLDGRDAYSERFDDAFGFYCGVAAVILAGRWFHITANGQPLYASRYAFVGNFQSNYCVVCDDDGWHFHIDLEGEPIYSDRWRYCGDYREEIAVVQNDTGLSSHINSSGELLHGKWFLDLDVYHKGFARARGDSGWFHMDRFGRPAYDQRYAQVENFYNGCARVEGLDGSLLVIDEGGAVLRELRPSRRDYFGELSADMVGYWRTFTLSTAAELRIFDHLPACSEKLAGVLVADSVLLERLLRGLAEMGVVYSDGDLWRPSEKGQYLKRSHDMTLHPAALEYGRDLLDRWRALTPIIKGASVNQDVFGAVAADSERCGTHHKMLASYALHDYPALIDLMNIQPGDVVFDAAGGSGSLSRLMAKRYPAAHICCGDISSVLCDQEHVQSVEFDLFKPWPIKANKIVLARVLHDWNDDQVVEILHHARAALLPDGEIMIIEMLLSESSADGALCDLHLLAVTGGQERSLSEYEQLCDQANLSLLFNISGPGLVSMMRIGVDHE